MTTTESKQVLTDELLARCAERAPIYDKENRFFDEDFEELKAAGYLKMAIPSELGGLGMTFAEVMDQTRRLAYHAHATAVALNMHVYWTGLVADVWRSGDKSLEWILREAAKGKVFAAGHSESGNDVPVLLSTTDAQRVDGGYVFTGHKNFGSLTPVWDYLGLHGMDTSDPEAPKIVHAFMPRDSENYRIQNNWDVMGMRATQSHDTVLEATFVPDKHIARVVPAGAGGVDLFVLGIFAWALTGFANVYYGIAKNAFDKTIAGLQNKQSIGLSRPMVYHAEVQHKVAEMVLTMEAIEPQLDQMAQDWTDGVDYGAGWVTKIVAAKHNAVEGSWKVIDTAMDLTGGAGIFEKTGFERLFRDGRLGRLHPTNGMLTHEFVAKTTLGINPDEAPRWG